jgi:hypothetical protein
VHPYRSKPGEDPKEDRPDSLGLLDNPNNLGLPFNIGSNGNFNAGGQRHASCDKEECHITQTESASSRSGVLPYSSRTTGLGFSAFYKWAIDMKTIHVYIYAKVPELGYEFESRMTCPGQDPIDGSQSLPAEMSIQTSIDLPVLKLQLDESYKIQKGEFEKSASYPWGLCMNAARTGMMVTWPNVEPTFPPTRDTYARKDGD